MLLFISLVAVLVGLTCCGNGSVYSGSWVGSSALIIEQPVAVPASVPIAMVPMQPVAVYGEPVYPQAQQQPFYPQQQQAPQQPSFYPQQQQQAPQQPFYPQQQAAEYPHYHPGAPPPPPVYYPQYQAK